MFKQIPLFVIALSMLCTSSVLADPPVKLLPGENSIYCISGQTLEITGQAVSTAGFDHSLLDEGGVILDTHETDITQFDHYSYLWRATKPGTHRLHIDYVMPNGNLIHARRITVVVLDDSPLTISPLPDQSINDVTITGTGTTSAMTPVHVECFLDDVSVGTGDVKSSTFVLPLYKADSGMHVAYIQAVDAEGMRFVAPPQIITVPERIVVTVPPYVTLAHFGDPVPLSVSLAPGVKIARLTYSIGRVIPAAQPMVARRTGFFGPTIMVPTGPAPPPPPPVMQDVDTVTAAPSYPDNVSLDSCPDCDFQVQATAATDDGTVYCSKRITVHFVNKAADDHEAELRAEGERQAADLFAQGLVFWSQVVAH